MNNSTTLQSYNDNVQAYIEGTPQAVDGVLKEWIDGALANLQKDATILEIGTAFGRDADYIESQGYTINRTDAAKGFVELLQSQGHNARVLNILTDSINQTFDMIFADAVFLHFTEDELHGVLDKVHAALTQGGILAFSVKQGEGEEWSDEKINSPRYFKYWQADAIRQMLEAHNFGDIEIREGMNGRFLLITARPL